jgi:hypothetical protein
VHALNKAWIASGPGNLFTKVLDPETKEWVLPCHTAAAIRKWQETYALARRPRRTRTRAASTPRIAIACPRRHFRNRVPVAARPRRG